MILRADLHNHSCLSPCGDNDLTPAMLCVQALDMGIDFLALTDHNSGLNLPAFAEVAEICGIVPIFGLEVNTVEDVHVVSLFENLDDAMEFSSFVEFLLPNIPNNPKTIGDQLIVNGDGEVTGTFPKTLLGSCGISFENLVEEVLSRNGLVIPAHIDRSAFSAVSNLGFLPDLPYSAVECVRVPTQINVYGNTVIQGSDAHYLREVGRRAFSLEVPDRTFEGLKQGLAANKIKFRGQP